MSIFVKSRAVVLVVRSENLEGGESSNYVGKICPLVEIGLTDLPNLESHGPPALYRAG